ncbi:MAG: lipopolysaccharide heptosyltransferase II [Acidobacteria bacterium]|nr:lipopolysaccharide heptosyltransferase II [Acidobacteriota bacterium]
MMDLDGRTLLIRGTNWLGDTVMNLPAIRELRRHYPAARLVMVARPSLTHFFRWVPEVDEVIPYQVNMGAARWKEVRRMGRELRRRRPDAFLCLQNAFEAALLARLSGARERIGFALDGRKWLLTKHFRVPLELNRYHQLYYYLYLLQQAGLSAVDYLSDPDFWPDLSIRRDPAMRDIAQQWFGRLNIPAEEPVIGFHTGAFYGTAKHWLPERYRELILRLRREYRPHILLFGAPGERAATATMLAGVEDERIINLCGETAVDELIALIAHCHLFVSNDSGPMHVAAALQVPQIAIFGSTDPVATGPFSARAVVVKKPVECSPCFQRECPIDLRCFKAVTVDEIFRLIQDTLYKEYSPEVE